MNTFFSNKIMIVGRRDEETMDLGRRVMDSGYELAGIVHDSDEAFAVVRERRPHLVLLDDDIEAGCDDAGMAHRLTHDCDLPVVLVSKAGREEGRFRRNGRETYGHLDFPVNDRELQGMLQSVLIRHQVEIERRNLERQALAVQRYEGLEFMGNRVAHDFNNILQAVIGHVQIAALELPGQSPVHGSLDHVLKAALRGATLCKQFMSYSAQASRRPKITELSLVIRESQGLLRTVVSKGVDLDYKLAAGLPHIDLSPSLVQQMLFNLVINASEAIGQRPGRIRIATGKVWLRPHELAAMIGAPAGPEGEYVFLEVTDDAGGIASGVASRMFEPGFTTKFSGSGMGLAAVLRLAQASGGAVVVENRPKVGATFRVYLPVPRTQSAA